LKNSNCSVYSVDDNSIRLHRAASTMNNTEVFATSTVYDLDVLTEGIGQINVN